MRNALTLLFFLSSFSFIGFSQTDDESIVVSNCTKRSHITTPTVIQSTGGFDKEVTIHSSTQSGALDITDPEMTDLVASPNPTKGQLSVSVPVDFIGLEILIIDMAGRMVGNPIRITGTTQNLTIDGESGMYLLVIETKEKIIQKRIQLNTH